MTPAEQGRIIAEARLAGERLEAWPGDKPSSLADAYALQEEMVAAMGADRVGWKVGVTSRAAREALGLSAPIYGPLFAPSVVDSPARLAAGPEDLRIVEAEIAFRMGSDIAPGSVSPEALARAIATVHPVIELVGKRGPGGTAEAVEWVVADGGFNAGLAVGPGSPFDNALVLGEETVTVEIDAARVAEGRGDNVDTGPFGVALWLAQALDARGLGLRAGQIVSTGLTTPVVVAEPGQEVTARFSTLGEVRLTLG